MAIFTDDFNRANGALGGNWSAVYGALDILGGWVRQNGVGFGTSVNSTLSDNGRHECTTRVTTFTGGTNVCGPIVKFIPGNQGCYSAQIRYAAPNYFLSIYAGTIGTMAYIASVQLPSAPAGIVTIKLIWDNGVATASLSTGESVSVNTNTFPGGTLMGISAQTTVAQVDSVTMITGAGVGLSIDPEVIPNYGECSTVTLTGSGTEWVAGTPGSPIFTVNHGTIQDQTVTDSTHATLTYCPGDYLGPVCFTDPSTNTQVCTTVSSDPDLVPPGGQCACLDPLTWDALDGAVLGNANPHFYASNTDIGVPNTQFSYAEWINLLFNFANTWGGTGGTGASGLLSEIRQVLNGHADPPVGNWLDVLPIPLHQQVNSIYNSFTAQPGGTQWSLDEILLGIKGGDWRDLSQIYALVSGLANPNLQPVLDAIDAMRYTGHDSIANIASQIDLLTNAGTQDIDTILQAIANIDPGAGGGIQAVIDLLNTIRGDETTTLASMLEFLVAIDDKATTNQQHLVDIRGPYNQTFQTIIDAIGGGGSVNIQPILDAIAALRGDSQSTVQAIQASLAALRTGNSYTLQTILDRLGANSNGSNWTAPALGLLLLFLLLGLGAPEAVAIAAGGAGAAGIIAAIIALLPEVAAIIGSIWQWWRNASNWRSVPTAPVFPGIDRVEWLPPTHFNDAIRVVGPMDGAVIRINEPGKAPYAITMGEETRYARLGVFSFQSEETAYEHIQPIQFLAQLATPKAMDNAIAILVQCKPGTVGSVTPYRLIYPGPWPFSGVRLPV